MIELNLLPDVKLEYVHAQKARRRVVGIVTVSSIGAVGLAALFGIYVFIAQPVYGRIVDVGIVDANDKLQKVSGLNNYLTIQQQLDALPSLHNAKPIYSRIISYLPTLNPTAPNSIRINQLAIDSTTADGVIIIHGYAPSYTATTIFESTLKSAQFNYKQGDDSESVDLFSGVVITDTSLGEDANGTKVVNFTATLTVNEHVFAFDSNDATISVPAKDATGSASGAQVFSDTPAEGNQ